MRDNGLAVQNKNEYAWCKLRWRHGLYVFYCMVNRYGYVFMITYTTKYARWIQDSVAMFQCFSKEIENSRFLFSMYAFYENTHYTKKTQKVPF